MESGGTLALSTCQLKGYMFRGSAPAKIDDKGRLKVPTGFRRTLEDRYGREVFTTSVTGDSVLVYPLVVWEVLEERLAALPSTWWARPRST